MPSLATKWTWKSFKRVSCCGSCFCEISRSIAHIKFLPFGLGIPIGQTPARVVLPAWEFRVSNLVHAIQAGGEN